MYTRGRSHQNTTHTMFTDYLVAVPLGLALGISSTGPVAGGAFAFIQSTMGGIAAGGVMAGVQSVAMGGMVGTPVTLAVASVAGMAFKKLVLK